MSAIHSSYPICFYAKTLTGKTYACHGKADEQIASVRHRLAEELHRPDTDILLVSGKHLLNDSELVKPYMNVSTITLLFKSEIT